MFADVRRGAPPRRTSASQQASPAEVAERLGGRVSPAFLLLAEGLMVQSNGLGSLLSAVDRLGGFEAQYAQIERRSPPTTATTGRCCCTGT